MEFTLHGSDFTLTPRSDELEEHELRVFKLGGLNDAEHSFEVNDDGFKIKMATFELNSLHNAKEYDSFIESFIKTPKSIAYEYRFSRSEVTFYKVILRKEFGKLEWYNDLWKVYVIKGTEKFDDYLEKEMFKDFYSRDYKEKMVLWNNGMIDETVIEILEKCKKWYTKRILGDIEFQVYYIKEFAKWIKQKSKKQIKL